MKVSELEFDPNTTMAALEKMYILKALDFYQGNKTQAAQALGITIKTIYNRLHGYGLAEEYKCHKPKVKEPPPPSFELPSGNQ